MRMPELALPPPAAVPKLAEGEALGVWRLREPLHGSDAGQWYRARHALAADQVSAVLVLHRSERAAGVMLRFADQAGDLGQLAHPAIVVPTDSGVTAAGQPYLILAWREGQPLLRAAALLPLRERLLLLVQLCEALRYVHQQGWLLAEVDPAMLWVGAERNIQLMGVGLVRMPDPADPFERGTGPGALPGFRSPEIAAGEPPSLASEVYGLGALLTLLVDGRLPSEIGDGADDASPAAAWPGLSAVERLSLDALLHKAAAPLAARRHASAEALADDLRAWLAGQNHSALSLNPMPGETRVDIELDVVDVEPSSLTPWRQTWPQPASGSRRAWRWALTSLALATLAVGGWAGRQAVNAGAGGAERPASAASAPAPRG